MWPLQVSDQYFEKADQLDSYVLFFGSVKLAIIGFNTSNLNKHRGQCCGCFNAWSTKAPGMGFKLAVEEQESILKQLLEGLVAIQVSFSIFKSPRLRSVLK
ncbi:hypothetical protein O181_024276 [Austropuccinia psidii MF-1]|uniref:Uncharacterized protein n=1 Tax=Austropuccinia psidii MF-1 TaxID=1389203 RepID=A0A9Q3CGF1_9BASI|nr:hypothetical protein [Austropuccinia psidii MF-1]